MMKSFLTVTLMATSFASMADFRSGPNFPGGPVRDNERDGDRQLRECLFQKEELRRENNSLNDRLFNCQNDRTNQERVDQLSRENQELRDRNGYLLEQNRILKEQLAKHENQNRPMNRYFSYAACTDLYGTADIKYIDGAYGEVQLVSETVAKENVQKKFKCNYGVKVVKTEDLTNVSRNKIYCSAACTDLYGSADDKYLKLSSGLSRTEAEFNALRDVQAAYTCNYGLKIKSCQ